jgi:dienelactone hydrolase
VLHGWLAPGTNGAAAVEARALRCADEGYVALALSMRGWPLSGGADDCGLRQPDDVVAAVAWLRAQPGVAVDRIGIVGPTRSLTWRCGRPPRPIPTSPPT